MFPASAHHHIHSSWHDVKLITTLWCQIPKIELILLSVVTVIKPSTTLHFFISEKDMRFRQKGWPLPRPKMIHHIIENFFTEWHAPKIHIQPLRRFLECCMQTDLRAFYAGKVFFLTRCPHKAQFLKSSDNKLYCILFLLWSLSEDNAATSCNIQFKWIQLSLIQLITKWIIYIYIIIILYIYTVCTVYILYIHTNVQYHNVWKCDFWLSTLMILYKSDNLVFLTLSESCFSSSLIHRKPPLFCQEGYLKYQGITQRTHSWQDVHDAVRMSLKQDASKGASEPDSAFSKHRAQAGTLFSSGLKLEL